MKCTDRNLIEKGRKKEGRRKEEMRGGWEEVNGKAL